MLLFASLISVSFSLGGLAAPHIDPAAINAVRFCLAVLVMGVFATLNVRLERRHLAAP